MVEILYAGDANLTDEQIATLPFEMYRQGYAYYWKTHAHPNSTFKYTMSSLLDLMRWDATDQIELIDHSNERAPSRRALRSWRGQKVSHAVSGRPPRSAKPICPSAPRARAFDRELILRIA